jgi:hypothetical protein
MRIRWTYGNITLTVALSLLCAICALPVRAQDSPPSRLSANVTIHQVQVTFIGSGAAEGGSLNNHGRAYPFKLDRLGIGGFGVSWLDASGAVYNMCSLQDFCGAYGQVRHSWALGDQGSRADVASKYQWCLFEVKGGSQTTIFSSNRAAAFGRARQFARDAWAIAGRVDFASLAVSSNRTLQIIWI